MTLVTSREAAVMPCLNVNKPSGDWIWSWRNFLKSASSPRNYSEKFIDVSQTNRLGKVRGEGSHET